MSAVHSFLDISVISSPAIKQLEKEQNKVHDEQNECLFIIGDPSKNSAEQVEAARKRFDELVKEDERLGKEISDRQYQIAGSSKGASDAGETNSLGALSDTQNSASSLSTPMGCIPQSNPGASQSDPAQPAPEATPDAPSMNSP